MKKIIALTVYALSSVTTYADDLGVMGSDSWVTTKQFREWDIHVDDIPKLLNWAINFLLSIAGTISVIFIIIWAYQIAIGSLSQEKTKWKDTIIMALYGFWIATLSWAIMKFIISNFLMS